MPPSDRLAVAAHLHVAMRRKLGRVTDTEWMASNRDYAQAMLQLCQAQQDSELQQLAERLAAMWIAATPARPVLVQAAAAPVRAREDLAMRYVGRLR